MIRNKKNKMRTLAKTLITIGVFYLFFSFLNVDFNPVSWNPLQRLALGLVGVFSFYAYKSSPEWKEMNKTVIGQKEEKLNS